MRVWEIGTGTGYNAALLAHRLGVQNVTNIEVNPDFADHTCRALRTTGDPVTVITGDGAEGYPSGAPYDRIMSTAAVQGVLYPWVTHASPGGTILTPMWIPLGWGVSISVGDGQVSGYVRSRFRSRFIGAVTGDSSIRLP
jgi:protein-L-isoaspartate O-methyltransferase